MLKPGKAYGRMEEDFPMSFLDVDQDNDSQDHLLGENSTVNEKPVDSDFFNDFEDDFDEDDVRAAALPIAQ